jgi:hypothetical protein
MCLKMRALHVALVAARHGAGVGAVLADATALHRGRAVKRRMYIIIIVLILVNILKVDKLFHLLLRLAQVKGRSTHGRHSIVFIMFKVFEPVMGIRGVSVV